MSGPVAQGRFKQALLASDDVAIIAEIKRTVSVPRQSERRPRPGAEIGSGLSRRRGGLLVGAHQPGNVRRQRQRSDRRGIPRPLGLPVLRKDFITTTDDVHESQAMGADALLLIAADLTGYRIAGRTARVVSLFGDGRAHRSEIRQRVGRPPSRPAPTSSESTSERSPRARPSPWTTSGLSAWHHCCPDHAVKVAESGIAVPGGTTMAEVRRGGVRRRPHWRSSGRSPADPIERLQELLA